MAIKDIFTSGAVEEPTPRPQDGGDSVIGRTLFGGVLPNGQPYSHMTQNSRAPALHESIPPRRAISAREASQIQQALLVPQGTELTPPPKSTANSTLGVIGRLTAYVATPGITFVDTVAKWLGAAKEPQEIVADPARQLAEKVRATTEAVETYPNDPNLKNYMAMLAQQITNTWGPARNQTAQDAVAEVRHPTPAERNLAAKYAPDLVDEGNRPKQLEKIRQEVTEINQTVIEEYLRKTFSEEELRRCAKEIEVLIQEHNNYLELIHFPPLNLIAAAVLADPTLLPQAISAALFANELKRRGITIVLQQNPTSGQPEIRILIGGAGKSGEALPASAQIEWDQPLPQEVASDSNWGKRWFRFWSFLKTQDPTMVEAGVLTLVNPMDTTDKVRLPILVTKPSSQKSPLGGAKVLQEVNDTVRKARAIIEQAQQITRTRAQERSLPSALDSTQLPPTNPEKSLQSAYDESTRLLMNQGIRPDVVIEFATTWAKSIREHNPQHTVISSSEIRLPPPPTQQEKVFDDLMRVVNLLQNATLTPQRRKSLEQQKKALIQQLRELSAKR